jgi:hypothetical protein
MTGGNPIAKKIKLGMGNRCYELTKTKGSATSFRLTHSGNLNVTIDEGKFKKIN